MISNHCPKNPNPPIVSFSPLPKGLDSQPDLNYIEKVLKSNKSSNKGLIFRDLIQSSQDEQLPQATREDLCLLIRSLNFNNYFVGLELGELDFSGLKLNGLNLSQANLCNAILIDADLSNTTLYDTNLSKAKCVNAKFINANLTYSKLNDADLTDANLTDADVAYATDTMGTIIKGCDWTNAKNLDRMLRAGSDGDSIKTNNKKDKENCLIS